LPPPSTLTIWLLFNRELMLTTLPGPMPRLMLPVPSVNLFVLPGASNDMEVPSPKVKELAYRFACKLITEVFSEKLRSSPGAELLGATPATPLVVQLLASPQLLPSSAPVKRDDAALTSPAPYSVASIPAVVIVARVRSRRRDPDPRDTDLSTNPCLFNCKALWNPDLRAEPPRNMGEYAASYRLRCAKTRVFRSRIVSHRCASTFLTTLPRLNRSARGSMSASDVSTADSIAVRR
jgi:hypothetical protein